MMAGMLGAALVTSLWAGVHSGDFPFRAPRRSFGCWARTFTVLWDYHRGREGFSTRGGSFLVQWT